MAQRGHLLDPGQLPAAGAEPAEISHRRAGPLAIHQDHPDPRTAPRSLETSLCEYHLKAGSSFGLFCADHEEGFHRQTGSVFSFHLLLQQNPRNVAIGGRPATVLSSLSALRTSDDLDTRKARPHRANARTSPVHSSLDLA